jgi:hypothetical protein
MALQSVTAVAAVSSHLTELAITGVFTLQVWMVRALIEVRANTSASKQTLFGETGDNGINGTVKAHSIELRDHDRRLTRSETRLDVLDGGVV